MDTKIKALILLLFSAFTTFAQTPGINFAAKFNITSATGGDPYNITGIVLDDLSRFTGSDVQVNDSIYVIDGDQLYVLAVTSITSVVGPTVTLVANDPNNAGVSIPTGQAAICRPTDNYKLPLYISGLRDDLRSMVMNRQAQLIDDINGSAVSAITDFTSAGVNVPPSPAASLNGGETWRNMTTGELWGSDGNVWYPYTRGPKECQDTVLVSAITVQSGGSVTTGSPLIRNSSGVWEHMYNHPSGLNLIPDGVVTDIIVGGKAIVQYCGVRKGSGATPNTSYYVNQSISTGFTTTKPTTNIRPLGKVASNGDFLINAGLLFSRDNSQALPTNEVGFGNNTGTAITSDTTLHFFPASDKLRVSSPSNKGYVDINKGITINPDTLLTQQTFLKINAGKNSPYTYAPFGLGVEYGNQNPNTYPYKDYVWTFGPNAAGNTGVAFEPSKPVASINWETSWILNDQPIFEWHEHFKEPDSATIRLKSYTIQYKNALFPSAVSNIDLYQSCDQFNLRSPVTGGDGYFSASRDRTTGIATTQMYLFKGKRLLVSGFGNDDATLTFYQTGGAAPGYTKNFNLTNFGTLTLGPATITNTNNRITVPGIFAAGSGPAAFIFDGVTVGQGAIFMGGATPDFTNYILTSNSTGTDVVYNAVNKLEFRNNGLLASGLTLLNGKVGLHTNNPTAYLHIAYAGTAAGSTAPLKFTTTGAVLTGTPENGAVEVGASDNRIYYTGSSLTRNTIAYTTDIKVMREQSFTATAAQTAFTIAYSAPAVSGTSVPIRVYRNGVRLFYVASGPTITQFTYSGTTVTTAANTTGDIITIEYLN